MQTKCTIMPPILLQPFHPICPLSFSDALFFSVLPAGKGYLFIRLGYLFPFSFWLSKPYMSWSRLISWPIRHQGIFPCNLDTCFASRSPPLVHGIFALNSMEINLFNFLLELELVMKSTS